jgi:hypothetical protein
MQRLHLKRFLPEEEEEHLAIVNGRRRLVRKRVSLAGVPVE